MTDVLAFGSPNAALSFKYLYDMIALGCDPSGVRDSLTTVQQIQKDFIHNVAIGIYPSGGIFAFGPGAFKFSAAPPGLVNGQEWWGAARDATEWFAAAGSVFQGGMFISNDNVSGTFQQSCGIRRGTINGNFGNGAFCGDGLVFDSLFVGTALEDIRITACSGTGFHQKTTTNAAVFGPAVYHNLAIDHCHDNLNVPNGYPAQMILEDDFHNIVFSGVLDLEHYITGGGVGARLKGRHKAAGGAVHVYIESLYEECDQALGVGVWVDGTSFVRIGQWEFGGAPQAGQTALLRSGNPGFSLNSADGSAGTSVVNFYALRNAGFAVVTDQTGTARTLVSATAPCPMVDYYSAPDTRSYNFAPLPAPPNGTTKQNPDEYDQILYIILQGDAAVGRHVDLMVGPNANPALNTLLSSWDIPANPAGAYGAGSRITVQVRVPCMYYVTVISDATFVQAFGVRA